MADRLLTPFTPQSSRRALRTLQRRGVEVRLGVGVSKVEADRVHLTDGSVIHAHTTIWATGVTAEPLAAHGRQPDRSRWSARRRTGPLTLPGHPEVFAIGDIAVTPGPDGAPLPQVAQPAIQGGKHVARQILRRLDGLATEPFRVPRPAARWPRSVATTRSTELANGWRLAGPIGWLAWLGLHLVYLMGFRNRINVFVNWAWNYLTYDRGSRILRESERRNRRGDARQTGAMRG